MPRLIPSTFRFGLQIHSDIVELYARSVQKRARPRLQRSPRAGGRAWGEGAFCVAVYYPVKLPRGYYDLSGFCSPPGPECRVIQWGIALSGARGRAQGVERGKALSGDVWILRLRQANQFEEMLDGLEFFPNRVRSLTQGKKNSNNHSAYADRLS
jgi:hypothetical protein